MYKITPFRITLFLLSAFLTLGEVHAQVETPSSDSSSPPVNVTGGLSLSGSSYQTASEFSRRDPFTWLVSGNMKVSAGRFSMPITAVYSKQRKNINIPFQRYGASPTWDWGRAHVGDRSLNFSNYALGGANFRGAGLELFPSILRFGVMYGRFQAAREENVEERIRASYKRMGAGIKFGLGTDRNFVDITAFRATDDTLSIENPITGTQIAPQENVVLALNSRFSLGEQVELFAEGGISGLNRDSRLPDIDTEGVPSFLTNIFTPKESTQASTALRVGADIRAPLGGVRVEFSRIDPDFQSLGSYYFTNDIQNITISPRLVLGKGKINLSGSGGISRNNIGGDLQETTHRLVGNGNLTVRFNRAFSVSAQYGNFSNDLRNGIREITDSTRVKDISQNFSISPRISFGSGSLKHNLSARVFGQSFTQVSEFTLDERDSKSNNISLSYSLNATGSNFQFRLTGNRYNSEAGERESKASGVFATVNKGLFDRKLNLGFNVGIRSRQSGELDPQSNLTGALTLSASPTTSDSFSVNSNYGGQLTDPVAGGQSLSELLTTFTYTRRF